MMETFPSRGALPTTPVRSPLDLEGWIPPMADIGWIKRKFLDVPYGIESKNQCFDLYLPQEGDGPFPLVIHIHGGGFAMGDKRDDLFYTAENLQKVFAFIEEALG